MPPPPLICDVKGCRRPRSGLPGLCAAHTAQCWRAGILSRLLDSNQLRTYRKIRKALSKPFGRYILRWARRTGKTMLFLVIALEDMIQKRGIRINVAAATKESLAQFIWPNFYKLLATCPESLAPLVQESRGRVTFHRQHGKVHESVLVFGGCNDKRAVERLRGPEAHLNIVEECGAIPDDPGPLYILSGVLGPQVLTTGGGTLIAGTPPKSSAHEFVNIVRNAEAMGEGKDERGYSYRTLYDNPRMTPELIQAYLAADAALAGLSVPEYLESPDYRREWLAIMETDPRYAILPNWTEERAAECKCPDRHNPAKCRSLFYEPEESYVFADRYTAMDIGFSPHWTGILYATWSFEHKRLLIEGERELRLAGSPEIATAVREDEVRLWGRPDVDDENNRHPWMRGELTHPPFQRWSDNNNLPMLHDLAGVYGLNFYPTAKDNRDAAIADVRRWIGEGRIIVSPRCPRLRAQMLAGVWNKAHTDFAESKEYGHFDLVAALVYLVRNVLPNINRVPPHYGTSVHTHWQNRRGRVGEDAALEEFLDA